VNSKKIGIEKLIGSFKNNYLSWKCINSLPDDIEKLTTLMPKCVLRPDGNLYACPGYNYVYYLGNVKKKKLKTLLKVANKNITLKTVISGGLMELYRLVKKTNPSISKEKLSISYGPCDVCQYLSKRMF
jgi:hypothetical protein